MAMLNKKAAEVLSDFHQVQLQMLLVLDFLDMAVKWQVAVM